MSSPSSLLVSLLLTVLQLALSVDAKGGGKGSKSSKTSKKKSGSGSGSGSKYQSTTSPVVYQENGRCYDEKHVEIPCPAKKTGLIVGIAFAVVAAIIILALAIWFFKRRSTKKRALDEEGTDDTSSDHESIVPLVRAETKDSGYSYYTDKNTHV